MKAGIEGVGASPSTRKPGPPGNGPGPTTMSLGRHPRDLVVLLVALAVVTLCSLIARRSALNPVETAIYQQIERIPQASVAVWQVLDWAGGWAGVAAVTALALYLKRFRLGLQCAAAGALAWGLAGIAGGLIDGRPLPGSLLLPGIRVPGPAGFAFPAVNAAMAAAMAAVAAPYLQTGYRRTAWVLAVLVATAGVYLGHSLPVDAFGGVFLGWAIGTGFHLVLGAPGRRTSAAAVQQALTQAGLAPV